MKRRRFIQTIAAAPALAVPALPTAAAPAPAAEPQGAAQQARPSTELPKLEMTTADAVAEFTPRFFTAQQFAALRKLSELLMPAMNGNPGALDAKAPEFLDFLIGASPADRQQIYRTGLDLLNAQSVKQFKKPFADVDASQAATLLAPLRQEWTYVPPTDPLARFLREAKADVRTATVNSREYNTAGGAAGRRAGGVGQYWFPLD